jgi:hypothetical protein
MSAPRRVQLATETTDWGTDALTGLIAPSVRQSQAVELAPVRAATTGTSPVRLASYALVAVLLVGAAMSLASAVGGSPTPKPRPRIEARQVKNPTRKAAALALSRGDYREALGQYRGLSQLYPEESTYRSLIRVLERRLTPKTP